MLSLSRKTLKKPLLVKVIFDKLIKFYTSKYTKKLNIMGKTRAQRAAEKENFEKNNNDEVQKTIAEIREKAKKFALNRPLNGPPVNPALSASKQKVKAKRNSKKFERLISSVKKNLSKVCIIYKMFVQLICIFKFAIFLYR